MAARCSRERPTDARHRPAPSLEWLLELAASYQCARTLFTLIELDVPARLADGPRTGDELARVLALHPMAADRFLRACVALGLLTLDGERYANAPVTARYPVRGAEDCLGDYLRRHEETDLARWAELTPRLRAWRPGRTDGAEPPDDDQGVDALEAQHTLARIVGRALADAYDFPGRTARSSTWAAAPGRWR